MLKINNIVLLNDLHNIEKYFSSIGESVENTRELNNVILTYSKFPRPDEEPITKQDEEERFWIYENIDSAIDKIRKNKFTRQAIIYNLHKSGLDHNCLNTFHLYFRNNKLNLNVYIRSMNFDDNFIHDLYTFSMVLEKASDELKLNKGQITLFIMSLHKFVK